MQNIIEIADLTYYYNKVAVLQSINLTMKENDFFVLFGEDDAGKTTLLNLLMGFDNRYLGKAEIFGVRADHFDKQQRQQVRFIPDDIIWEPGITADDYFAFWGSSKEYNIRLSEELCIKYEINRKERLLDMTYQNNKLVQIIAAVCMVPKLLILDEPLNYLDMDTYRNLLEDLKKLNRKGMTILAAAERYADIGNYCNKYAYMKEGQIICHGEIPVPDFRWKVVSVYGGNQEYLKAYMEQFLFERNDRYYYLYCKDMELLPQYLKGCDCLDCIVEEMTFEEEINHDFSRWELEKL